ncbi:MAG TPA: hypothetical protein DHV49_06005 [Alphaproteobacteria bacterium]|nr:hypothetical protein [Alphaproteobacteria bacterium]
MINLQFIHDQGHLLLKDENSTWGYCLYADNGGLDYIFVHPLRRGTGLGRFLINQLASMTDAEIFPATPLSAKGRKFCERVGLMARHDPGLLREALADKLL